MSYVDKTKGFKMYRLVRVSDFVLRCNVYWVTNKRSNLGYLGQEAKKELIETQEIFFTKASPEEIIRKRVNNESGIVMVFEGETYFANAPRKARIETLEEVKLHKCRNCMRLSAKPDAEGGCAKVRDLPISLQDTERSIRNKMRIEKYAFITEGMESVNTVDMETLVIQCEHFEPFTRI